MSNRREREETENLNEKKRKKKTRSYVLAPRQRDDQLRVPRPRPGPAPPSRGLGGEGREPQRPEVGHQRGVQKRSVGERPEAKSLGFPFRLVLFVVAAVFRGSLPDDRVAELPVFFVYVNSSERVRKRERAPVFGSRVPAAALLEEVSSDSAACCHGCRIFSFSSQFSLSLSRLPRDALDVLDVLEEPHPQPPGQRGEREVHGRRDLF